TGRGSRATAPAPSWPGTPGAATGRRRAGPAGPPPGPRGSRPGPGPASRSPGRPPRSEPPPRSPSSGNGTDPDSDTPPPAPPPPLHTLGALPHAGGRADLGLEFVDRARRQPQHPAGLRVAVQPVGHHGIQPVVAADELHDDQDAIVRPRPGRRPRRLGQETGD